MRLTATGASDEINSASEMIGRKEVGALTNEEDNNENKREQNGIENNININSVIDGYFEERTHLEEYFMEREQKRIKMAQEEAKTRSAKQKDYSPLCNRYIWYGECWKKGCRYTHKSLCRSIENKGICNIDGCREGHNTESICRFFNYSRGCKFSAETCRYLHIKIKNVTEVDTKKKRDSPDEKGHTALRTEEIGPMIPERNEGNVKPAQDKIEITEERNMVQVFDTERKERTDEEEEMICVDEWHWEDDGYEAEDEHDDHVAETKRYSKDAEKEKDGCKERTETHADIDSQVEKTGRVNEQVNMDRKNQDQTDFLRMCRKHNVWKEIQATKAEIRELEKEVKVAKRHEDRSL